MPPSLPKSTLTSNPEHPPSNKSRSRLLTRLCSALERFRPVVKWVGSALLMVTVMRAATLHFSPGPKPDQVADLSGTKPGHPGTGGSRGVAWWSPVTPLPDVPDQVPDSAGSLGSSNSSTESHSVVPIDRSVQLSSSPFSVKPADLAPIGSNRPQEAYLILGLSGGSNPGAGSGSAVSGDADLHFSLAGNLGTVPTFSISGGALATPMLAPVPEPATGGMLAAGIALLAWRRRRRVSA